MKPITTRILVFILAFVLLMRVCNAQTGKWVHNVSISIYSITQDNKTQFIIHNYNDCPSDLEIILDKDTLMIQLDGKQRFDLYTVNPKFNIKARNKTICYYTDNLEWVEMTWNIMALGMSSEPKHKLITTKNCNNEITVAPAYRNGKLH